MGYFNKNSSGKLKTIMTDRIEDVEKTLITGNDGKSNYTGSDDYLAKYH